MGWSSGETEGTSITSSAMPPSSSGSRSVRAITMPSRALTSCMLLFAFSETCVARGDGHHGHVLVDQGDRAVLHLAGRVALGVDVGDLLELERAFEGDRVVDAAAEVEEVLGPVVAPGELVHGLLLAADRPRRPPAAAGPGRPGSCRSTSPIRTLAQVEGEQVEGHELGGEGLGRGDADLRAGVGVDHPLADAGRLAPHDVADGEEVGARARGRPPWPRGCPPSRRTGRCPRPARGRRRSGRGSGTRSRSPPRPGCGRAPRSGTCRPARSARRCRRPGGAGARPARSSSSVSFTVSKRISARLEVHAPGEGVLHGLGLLVDLLEHEVLVAALLGLDGVPVEALHGPLDRLARRGPRSRRPRG